jgi:hypothetical protein
MKLTEFRKLIREEIRNVLGEQILTDIPNNHPLKKDVESVFNTTFAPYCFKFDQREDLVGINIDYLSDDTGIDPNKVTSLVRGVIRKKPADYMEIKMERGGGSWPEKYKKAYPSLEELDPDYYMVVKLRI